MLIITIVVLVLGLWPSIFFHELSHALAFWYYGGKVTKFTIFPHKLEGTWYLGRIVGKDFDPVGLGVIYYAPHIKAWILMFSWIWLSTLWLPFLVLTAWEVIEILNWHISYFLKTPRTDGYRFRQVVEYGKLIDE